jgi:hypothetical protein
MNIRFDHGLVQLQPHRSLDIVDGAGTTVHCLRGSVWITQDGDSRDIVLVAGRSFTLDRAGVAIVHAIDAPTLLVAAPAARAPRAPAALAALRAGLAGLARRLAPRWAPVG